MASLSATKFVVGLAEFSDEAPRSTRRVILNADTLKACRICAGDLVILTNRDKIKDIKSEFAVGCAWPSLDVEKDAVLVSAALLLTAALSEGAKIHIHPIPTGSKTASTFLPLKNLQPATIIKLKEIPRSESEPLKVGRPSHDTQSSNWLSLALRESLVDLKYITSGQKLEILYEGRKRRFVVVHISAQHRDAKSSVEALAHNVSELSLDSSWKVWTAGWDTSVVLLDSDKHESEAEVVAQTPPSDAYGSVGGLDKQVAQIRDLLEIPLTRPELFRHLGLKPPRGILLHGPPGTGKTHLARAIAAATNASVLVINGPELSSAYHGETESKLRDVFREAREKSPCIVVLDEVDALVPRREDGAGGEVEKRVVATLLTILDGMEDGDSGGDPGTRRVVVIGTTNRPNAIDPALRRPGRFDREIEIGIPDATARCAILNVLLSKTPHTLSQDDLRTVAAGAHGYVGADLSAVVREAGTLAIKRWLASSTESPPAVQAEYPTLTAEDIHASLPTVRPSAMRSVFLETAPVRYTDIGGQDAVASKLREAVEWPLRHPEAFVRLGVRPPKGVLLYGPPGCSKTVLARACACESGVNFVAVKGPELLNKYVGESERALREIFRKARAASPSIIFFDEIDALATSRSANDGGAGSHEGVLTSLLNEMDGVQELVGVTVVAATNRPDVLDSALMRPGRLDRLLYVGPPDLQGRAEILRICMRKMSVGPDVGVQEIAEMTDGCSGAEISALCQEAALLTMQKDMDAPYVPHEAFITAALATKRQITPEVIERFEVWRKGR
ncbi:hypothetical protein PLICRDRAFT_690240 [Plicaturopsis crispa FD-325 SS-3]|nr:hypothetical protein PLICRDRAFT_690240 [Plicaturopsis crispa FD-325 SS-3]